MIFMTNNYISKMGSLIIKYPSTGVSFYRKNDALKYIKKMGIPAMVFENKSMTGKAHTWTVRFLNNNM